MTPTKTVFAIMGAALLASLPYGGHVSAIAQETTSPDNTSEHTPAPQDDACLDAFGEVMAGYLLANGICILADSITDQIEGGHNDTDQTSDDAQSADDTADDETPELEDETRANLDPE